MKFVWGMIVGWISAGAAALLAGWVAYGRILALQTRAKQAERMAELGTLTGGLAHEIKNPLSTIQLNLQLAKEDILPSNPAFSRLLNRMSLCEREAGRLKDILDDFLRYAGRIELDRKPIELNRMCEELVDFFHPQAQLQKVQLRFRPAGGGVTILADERLLKQAVLNLILNGVQAMPQGGEMILSVRGEPNEAVISVVDTGTGISHEAVAKIFDAYYSTKKSGTGLGLAMTRRIAEEHGGRVGVTSEVGKGSEFRLHLPLGA